MERVGSRISTLTTEFATFYWKEIFTAIYKRAKAPFHILTGEHYSHTIPLLVYWYMTALASQRLQVPYVCSAAVSEYALSTRQ